MFDHETTWTQEHLRGMQRIALLDAQANERLAREVEATKHTERDDCACGCGKLLPAGFSGDMLKLCRRRLWMQADRARKAAKRIAEKAKSLEIVPCMTCGVQTRKWNAYGHRRKCCDACRTKSWRWRQAQRVKEVTCG